MERFIAFAQLKTEPRLPRDPRNSNPSQLWKFRGERQASRFFDLGELPR